MGKYSFTKEDFADDVIIAAKQAVKAEETLAKAVGNQLSLAKRCNANIQQYVDAMLPGREGSDREKWAEANDVERSLRKELGEKAGKDFQHAIRQAITARREALNATLKKRQWSTLNDEEKSAWKTKENWDAHAGYVYEDD
jgi:hypothetical protein